MISTTIVRNSPYKIYPSRKTHSAIIDFRRKRVTNEQVRGKSYDVLGKGHDSDRPIYTSSRKRDTAFIVFADGSIKENRIGVSSILYEIKETERGTEYRTIDSLPSSPAGKSPFDSELAEIRLIRQLTTTHPIFRSLAIGTDSQSLRRQLEEGPPASTAKLWANELEEMDNTAGYSYDDTPTVRETNKLIAWPTMHVTRTSIRQAK